MSQQQHDILFKQQQHIHTLLENENAIKHDARKLQLLGVVGFAMSVVLGCSKSLFKSYSTQFNKYRINASLLIGLSSFYLLGYQSVVIWKSNSKISKFEKLQTQLLNHPTTMETTEFMDRLRTIKNSK